MKRIVKNRNSTILKALLYPLLFLLLTGCGALSTENRELGFEGLRELVSQREFVIEHDWAFPLTGNRINLLDNPNFIRFKGDSVEIFLPYFGVRHSGVKYGSRDGGILYEGPISKLTISENPDREKVTIRFEGNQDNENLQFFLTLFPNRNVRTSVNSSQRNAISYQGEIIRTSLDQEH